MYIFEEYGAFNKNESPIFVFSMFFVSKGNILDVLFYFTSACVNCRVGAVKRLRVLHHSVDYIIYISLGSLSHFWLLVNTA